MDYKVKTLMVTALGIINEPPTRRRTRKIKAYRKKNHETKKLIHKDLEHRNLLQAKSLNLKKIMNEMMSKRRIQITDLQKERFEMR